MTEERIIKKIGMAIAFFGFAAAFPPGPLAFEVAAGFSGLSAAIDGWNLFKGKK